MGKSGRFGRYVGGAMQHGAWEGISLQDPPGQMQKLEIYVSFFQNPSVGASYLTIFAGRRRPERPKAGNGCVKNGGNFNFPQKYPPFLIDGDLIFAIRHDPIP